MIIQINFWVNLRIYFTDTSTNTNPEIFLIPTNLFTSFAVANGYDQLLLNPPGPDGSKGRRS